MEHAPQSTGSATPEVDGASEAPGHAARQTTRQRWRPALPRQCEICADWGQHRLCAACVDRLAPTRPRCPCCAIALPTMASDRVPCGECLRQPHRFDRTVAAVDYAFPWDRLVTRMKFHQRPDLAQPMARLLATAVQRSAAPLPDVLVPMPASRPRLLERGYNQAWELCRHLARQLHLPARDDLLTRGPSDVHQVGLTRRDREANLRHALWVEPGRWGACDGRTVALIDDVMTTGASADAAAHALRLAGATHIHVWVVARTPLDD